MKPKTNKATHNKTLVYHAVDPTFGQHFLPLPSEFQLVAEVEDADLERAFHLTNHLEDAGWPENEGVTCFVASPRSTSVGDILVSPDGIAHLCESVGWKPLGVVFSE